MIARVKMDESVELVIDFRKDDNRMVLSSCDDFELEYILRIRRLPCIDFFALLQRRWSSSLLPFIPIQDLVSIVESYYEMVEPIQVIFYTGNRTGALWYRNDGKYFEDHRKWVYGPHFYGSHMNIPAPDLIVIPKPSPGEWSLYIPNLWHFNDICGRLYNEPVSKKAVAIMPLPPNVNDLIYPLSESFFVNLEDRKSVIAINTRHRQTVSRLHTRNLAITIGNYFENYHSE